ncbi:MAG: GNAT family N-acetyltransferase [Ferruginibacter sp.]
MRTSLTKFVDIKRYGLWVRLVEESDAEFIVSLRTNSELNKYLSPTNNNVAQQVEWIRKYKLREAMGREYYFIAMDMEGKKLGMNRLYDFDSSSFEVGSWLFSANSPEGASIKADLIAREFGFETLQFSNCRFSVHKENKKVLAYHTSFKPVIVNETDEEYHFLLSKDKFNNYRTKLLNFLL